jgi:catechol 2,3-dioxygenase-like lactoylglutathione lyase family enzyme
MAKVAFGTHSKFSASPMERDRVRQFYRDVLGCKVTKQTEGMDYFRMGRDFYLAAIYEGSLLSKEDLLKSIWLELKTDNPKELAKRILEFGATSIATWDKAHFYFQAPGGQVFRLIGDTEDMSRFEG